MAVSAFDDAVARMPAGFRPVNPVVWLLEAFWQYRWLVMTVVLAGVVAAAVLADRLPDSYTASGLVEIDPQQRSVLAERQNTGFVPPETITETEVQVIRSYSVLLRVIDELDLEQTAANPALGEASAGGVRPTRDAARAAIVAVLARGLSVTLTGRSFVVEVAYEGRDPIFAADVANAVMAQYLNRDVSEQRAEASSAIAQLTDRLAELRRDLDARERAVEQFRSTSRVAETAGTGILAEQLARLNEELIRAQSAFASAAASSDQRGPADDALPAVVASPLIQELRAQASLQQRAVSELAALYRPTHPRLIQAREALGAINTTIAQETGKIADSLGTSAAVERSRVEVLQGAVDDLRERLNAQRGAEIALRRLEREVESAQRVYEAFLNRLNDVEGTAGLERPEGRIVAQAVAPANPTGPNRALVVAGGAIVSGGLAAALVVMLALIDSRLRTRGDVARATGLSPVAVVPPVPRTARGISGVIVGRRRNAAFAEAITQVRAALVLGTGFRGPAIVCLTAPERGVGHNALATALAQASAIAGDQTVLIDADLARPSVHEILGGRNEYGLADIVADSGDVAGALQRDGASGAMFISAGKKRDVALFRSPAVDAVLDRLYQMFDVIIICLPPLVEQPDAQALAAEASVTAIAVRAGVSDRTSLSETVAMLRFASTDPKLATVLIRS